MNQGVYAGGSGEYYPNVNTDIGGGYYDDGEYYVDDGVVVDENGVAYYYDEQGDQHYATTSADFQYDASYYDNNAAAAATTDEIESEGFVILGRRCNYQPPLVIHASDHCGMDDDNPASGGL
jgi:FlaG/FlaF family flagellin (archaellin)